MGRDTPGSITYELSRTIKPHSSPVVTVTTDRTGTLLGTGAADGIVKVWDIQGGYTTHTLHGHGSIVSALCFFSSNSKNSKKDPSGVRLAVGHEDGKIRIWNLQNRKSVAIFDSHVSVVRSLAFHERSNTLLSGSRDMTAMTWDAATWTQKKTLPILESVEACGFLSESVIFAGGQSGNLRLWNLLNNQELTPQTDATNHSILQTVHGQRMPFILSVHTDQTLLVHECGLITGLEPSQIVSGTIPAGLPVLRRISGTHDEVIDFGLVGQSRGLLAVATNVEEIRILSLGQSPYVNEGHSHSIKRAAYFGADVGVLRGHEDTVICLDVDWSGHWLVSGAKDNNAKLWKLDPENEAFEHFATFTGHAESIGAISFPCASPPSGSTAHSKPLESPPSFFVTGSQDRTVKRWDIAALLRDTAKPARATYTRKAHDKDINALDVNHSSKFFASASQDRTVKIWSLEDGEVVGILRGHRRGVWTVKFAPSNTPSISVGGSQMSSARGLILTGSGDKTVKIWSLVDYSCIRTFEGHTNSVLKVLWMDPHMEPEAAQEAFQDEKNPRRTREIRKRNMFVASAGGDGLVKVWDIQSNELATTLDNHIDRVWALAANPTNGGLISGGGDSVITFWKDTTSSTAAAAAAESTARVEQDQQLQNYMRGGSYREAITLALQLGHPARLLTLFTSIVGTYPPEQDSLCGVKAVDEVLANLADEQLIELLLRLRDWNANAKTAPVAQRLLWTIFRSYSPPRLIDLKVSGKKTNMKEVLDALRAYTERHYQRMEEMVDESFLVDYMLQELDQIGIEGRPLNVVAAGPG